MTDAMHDLENNVNDMINTARKLEGMLDDDSMAGNHPKIKELVRRLDTQIEHSRGRLAERGMEEPEMGQAEPQAADPQARTPDDVLSSPTAGAQPRYARQHDGRADPIERAHPDPKSEDTGNTNTSDSAAVRGPSPHRQADTKSAADDKNRKR